ncbi:hypothetical protein FOQG_18148 [Fusarium oxysporum f. sp. raphani 54005]|uniref:Uncharacterized protein n=4 Tax=Fusarium oxysporum TaxID=5507 RepID=X0BE99_FUSOX|nr:hypothetical protein FOXB_17101 [Fusarium oxysporum f. sp. conglutinans Fo5176]EXK77143.1 hypothetical protein FOQG_18148 [Fusarium oxysporum f. sp. raphani 54005]EXL65719.1 hypothetical protein FOPG_18062 [Fusarium oxysporum f. sp. conglutinans race 2 54008]KAG7410326.1 hypothetical protein Forpi1262_v017539 [Fusarium oxysporum f. sp. raphani]
MGAQEEFRNKHSRSGSRGLNSPASIKQDVSEHRHRANFEVTNFDGLISIHGRAALTQHAGDLKQMKYERQRKKEQAARELEERRKSLAKHAQAPAIPHPNEFSPALAVSVETAEPKPLPDDIPPRSATESPQRSMYARNGPVIGLPATPKAIRLIIEGNHDLSGSTPRPDVPAIPAGFSQRYSPEASPQQSSEREQPVPRPSLTLLPSTVYQPPARPLIPRSMSPPIPMILASAVATGERRCSHEYAMLPRSPSGPPILKGLRHLASPPPPPPAPLQHIYFNTSSDSSRQASEASPPALASQKGQSRDRSTEDISSILVLIHKANDRFRSASGSRKERVRSPPFEATYESIPMPRQMMSPPPVSFSPDALRSSTDSRNKHLSTGLDRNEMI